MPTDLFRALIVVLVLATVSFAFASKPACAIAGTENFTRRRNLWFALTLVAFLAKNFWLYALIAVVLLIRANRKEPNPTALYFFILFVLPASTMLIPGMGSFNYFFEISHPRMLALIILLPAFFSLRRQSDNLRFGRAGTDIAFAAYLMVTSIIYWSDEKHTLTSCLRQGFYVFIDVFLPYYIFSRSLKNMQLFRDTILSLMLAIMVVALCAVFEFAKHWLLYASLTDVLKLTGSTNYLPRDDMLRAVVTTGQAIALGYLMAVGIGFYFFIQHSIQQTIIRLLGMVLLVGGLIAPLSRGPWIGAVVLLIVFIGTGRNAARRLMSLGIAAMLVFFVVSILPGGERAINLLPFVGSTEKENIDYRDKLITNSMIVIQRNPWFGSTTFMDTPEMEEMRQGQGIIDIVNTYIGTALNFGFVGLGLFIAFFATTLLGIYRSMRLIPDKNSEEHLLGRVLLATLLTIMVIIFTVSSITIIPIVYYPVTGMGVAYAVMVRKSAARLITENTRMT